MAAAQVVVTQPNGDTPAIGGLFDGLSFFLVQRLPQRSVFVQRIHANGGRVVKHENQADHIIADHFRQDCPAGSISYTFIDDAISDGQLPDPNKHPAGPPPGTVRQAGSGVPGKSTRTPFSADDDRVLWQWVKRCEAEGLLVKGNEIYKQLEVKNPRHTYQAWRDRYIKRLMDKPPAGVGLTVAANAPPSPPTAHDEQAEVKAGPSARIRSTGTHTKSDEAVNEEPEFSEEDFDALMLAAHDIENVQEDQLDEAWKAWAENFSDHSDQSWRKYWEDAVRPVYLQRRTGENGKRRQQREVDGAPNAAPNAKGINKAGGADGDAVAATKEAMFEVREPIPSRPQSSGSQKRKRGSTASPAKRTYGRKKQKPSGAEIFGEQEDDDTAENRQHAESPQNEIPLARPIQTSSDDHGEQMHAERNMPTSELNAAAQTQLELEAAQTPARDVPMSDPSRDIEEQFNEKVLGTSRAPVSVEEVLMSNLLSSEANVVAAVPTSEFNREAQAQMIEEMTSRSGPSQSVEVNPVSNLPTSDVSRAADQQLQRESIERREEIDEEGVEDAINSQAWSSSPLKADKGVNSATAEDAPMSNARPQGDALTEANLLSQQAQHRKQLRGADLPDDDEMPNEERQDEYVRLLQSLVKQPISAQDPAIGPSAQTTHIDAVEDQQDLPPAEHDPLGTRMVAELPLSSQQEIDKSFEDVLQWPDSPQAPQQRDDSQSPVRSLELDTQVAYAKLPLQEEANHQRAHEHAMSDQAAVADHVVYPSLPQQPSAGMGDGTVRVDDEAMSSPLPDSQSSRSVISNGSEDESVSQEAQQEDHIDLTVPEPDGGWDMSSSPAKVRGVQAAETKFHEDNRPLAARSGRAEEEAEGADTTAEYEEDDEDDDEDEETVETIVKAAHQEVVELSSQSSSSSSDDSHEPTAHTDSLATDRERAIETQDIVAAETQLPDFDLPLPPDSEIDSNLDLLSDPLAQPPPSSPPQPNAATLESQLALPTTQKLPEEDVVAYIDTMVHARNFPEPSVIAALKCTSCRSDLAELVLLDERAGKGLPRDVAGIWSEAEDGVLESGDARGLRGLEAKHTWDEVMERMKFLEEWREDEDE
ncbi:hypothetical protein LTR37_013157 [Vermiconidia calcicola]|uniref:Uncharacterized protein n=1 Tax=Vermiconidia calcicola TaxID=1690605 RepID=A0ACC3MXB0_9PEZI|nr:hypothetical protein LTR37_013157 [Vermiconidia calcicola]